MTPPPVLQPLLLEQHEVQLHRALRARIPLGPHLQLRDQRYQPLVVARLGIAAEWPNRRNFQARLQGGQGGPQLVARVGAERQREVYVSLADGSDVQNVSRHPADDFHIAWSGDGALLAFTSMRDGNAELYALGVDEGRLWRLTRDPAQDDRAAYSTSGRVVAFESTRESWRTIGGAIYLVVLGLPLAHVFGRFGCIAAGCCWGDAMFHIDAGVGIDHYELAVEGQETQVVTIPVYMVGVRRTAF